MGGLNSGRARSKTYLGQLSYIKLNDVKEYFGNTQGRHISGTMSWSNGNQMGVTYNEEGFCVSFSSNGQSYSQQINKTHTACTYGGQGRLWMLCGCGGRTNKLYLHKLRFVCRKCTGLAYGSQSLTPEDRQAYTIRRLQKKLDKAGEYEIQDFPDRPKGMHSSTYEKVTDKLAQVIEQREGAVGVRLTRVLKRFKGMAGLLEEPEAPKKLQTSRLWRE